MNKQNQTTDSKINQQDLNMEIVTALKDLFVAQVQNDENGITMHFLNGQKFRITTQEL